MALALEIKFQQVHLTALIPFIPYAITKHDPIPQTIKVSLEIKSKLLLLLTRPIIIVAKAVNTRVNKNEIVIIPNMIYYLMIIKSNIIYC